MSYIDKSDLLRQMIDSHSATRLVLDGVDFEVCVYTDTGWRIRDILGHLATWDRQVAKGLRAFREGAEYIIPDIDEGISVFNEKAILLQNELSTQQIVVDWDDARDDLIEAIREIPSEIFRADLTYPWKEGRGGIVHLVEIMIGHDVEHRDEIAIAKGREIA